MAWKFSPIFKYTVKGISMEPTYTAGDTVYVNRLAYLFKNPKVGDIVVVKNLTEFQKNILKRINKIERKKYFLIGDNNKGSTDSRHFGPIKKHNIEGKVIGM